MVGGSTIVVVVVVVTVFVEDVDDGRRDLVVDFGVITCRTGESDGVGWDGRGDSLFNGENKSKSSKLHRSISFDTCGRNVGGGGTEETEFEVFKGDFVSGIVRCRFRDGVCDDETDGERDRWRRCFRVFDIADEWLTSIGSVSSTTQFFSLLFVRSYSASDTNGVNFDFFFLTGD